MNSFERTAFGLDRNQDTRTNIYVTKRKDGKFSARYAFHGKTINKVLTAEKLKAEHESGRYRLVGVDALEVI